MEDMGTVIDLKLERKRRRPARRAAPGGAPAELERAIRRLTPLVRRATEGGRDPQLETELLAAIGAVASGLPDEALARLERLSERLEPKQASSPVSPTRIPSRRPVR